MLLVRLVACFRVLTQRFSTEPDDFLPRHEDPNGSLEERDTAREAAWLTRKS